MGNLLSAGVYRLLRSKVFYVGLLASVLLEVYVISVSREGSYFVMGLEYQGLFSCNLFLPLVVAAFCGLFLGTDHANGTLRNQLVAGHGKTQVYLANLLLSAGAAALFFLAASGSGVLYGLATGSRFQFSAFKVGGYFLLSLCVALGAASLSSLFANLFSNRSVGLVVSVLLATGLLFLAGNLSSTMNEPPTIPQYRPVEQIIDGTAITFYEPDPTLPEVPNPAYPTGALRGALELLWNFLPACQGMQLSAATVTRVTFLPLLGWAALFIALTTALGLGLFQRKDIK